MGRNREFPKGIHGIKPTLDVCLSFQGKQYKSNRKRKRQLKNIVALHKRFLKIKIRELNNFPK